MANLKIVGAVVLACLAAPLSGEGKVVDTSGTLSKRLPGSAPADADAMAAGQAVVYIHRGATFVLGGRQAQFFIDGSKVATLNAGGCAIVRVVAGDHELRQNWLAVPLLEFPMTRKIVVRNNWEAGRAYHYLLDTRTGFRGGSMELQWQLSQIDPPPETSTDRHVVTNAPCH